MTADLPSAVPPSHRGEAEPHPLGWLLAMLQEAMTGVMEAESPPLQKANAVARLGSLYLKAYQVVELKQANKTLTEQVAELEHRLAAAEANHAPLARDPTSGRKSEEAIADFEDGARQAGNGGSVVRAHPPRIARTSATLADPRAGPARVTAGRLRGP